jgi:predicted nucleic acid-binding protein
MSSWVLDCSMVMGWCLPDEKSPVADRFFQTLPSSIDFVVPALFWYEVANVLVIAVRRKRISSEQASQLQKLVKALPLTTIPSSPQTMTRIVALAEQLVLTAYDAAYLDLARHTNSSLASLDSNLLDSARKCMIPVSAP